MYIMTPPLKNRAYATVSRYTNTDLHHVHPVPINMMVGGGEGGGIRNIDGTSSELTFSILLL